MKRTYDREWVLVSENNKIYFTIILFGLRFKTSKKRKKETTETFLNKSVYY